MSDSVQRLPKRERAKAFFDLESMKRRFGPPPLFGRDEKKFDEFMHSLASCLDEGDGVIATYLYQFGLEIFRKMMLLQWRSESLCHAIDHIPEAHAIEERTRRLQERESEAEEIKEELVELCFDAPSTQFELREPILNIDRYVSNAWREIEQARAIEVNLDSYARIDRLIDQCTKRAKEAWQRIGVQSVVVAQRLDDEWHEMIYQMQCAPVG